MTEIPIKTRQRILRKARLFLAYGQADFINVAITWSYPSVFKDMCFSKIMNMMPEMKTQYLLYESKIYGDRQDKINLLSDAITDINQKIKEESCPSWAGLDESKRSSARREKISYSSR